MESLAVRMDLEQPHALKLGDHLEVIVVRGERDGVAPKPVGLLALDHVGENHFLFRGQVGSTGFARDKPVKESKPCLHTVVEHAPGGNDQRQLLG